VRYRAWVFANQLQKGSKIPTDIRLLDYLQSDDIFYLKESFSSCAVDPKGAEIIHSQRRTFYNHAHCCVEEYLPADKRLYVLGYLDTRHHLNTEVAIQKEVKTLITEWKASPSKMLLRFDHDRSGKVDMQECEKARTEARREVEIKHQMQAHMQMYTLAKPKNNQLYLISALSPHALHNQYKCWRFVHLDILALILLIYFRLV